MGGVDVRTALKASCNVFTASKKGDPKVPQAEEQAREDSLDVAGKIRASPCCLPYHLGFQPSHCPLLSNR